MVLYAPAVPSRFNRGGLAANLLPASPALEGVTWTYSDVGSATYTGRVDRCNGAAWVMIVPPSGTYAPLTVAGQEQLLTQQANALRAWFAGLASRNANMLMVGDSNTEGQGTTVITKRWLDRYVAQLRAQYQPSGVTGGRGYWPGWYAVAAPTGQGPVITGSPTKQNNFGPGRRATLLTSATPGPITWTVTGTSVDIMWVKGSTTGSFTYSVDGGSTTTVNTVGASTLDGNLTRVALGASGSHTVAVQWSAGGTCFIDGVMVYDGDEASGIRVVDGGHYGLLTGGFSSNVGTGSWTDIMKTLLPSLVVICLGTNDYRQQTSLATYTAGLTTIIAALRAAVSAAQQPSIVLMSMFESGESGLTPVAPWTGAGSYTEAVYNLVAADGNLGLIDLNKRMVRGDLDQFGLVAADKLHMTDKGHQFVADVLYRELTPR